jgi:hypothetical protein
MGNYAASPELLADSAGDRQIARVRPVALQVLIFLAAFLLVLSRRPDAVVNAQFFAEDGKFWYADAYHFGLRCLLMPESGYLHTLSRSIALLSVLFPLSLAPLVMNLCAILVQVLPVNLFLSSRFGTIPYAVRLFGSLVYLALPNSSEIDANITTIQWHLALLALLFLVSEVQPGRAWRWLGNAALLFVSVDGPLGILLVPVAAVMHWRRRPRQSLASLALLIPGALLQLCIILLSHSRRAAENGANFYRLLSILGRQVFLSALVGSKTVAGLAAGDDRYLFPLETIAAILGVAVVVYALRYAPLELKLFFCFAIAIFAVSLVHPIGTTLGRRDQWEVLQIPGIGVRYYFFPMLAFLIALYWMARNSRTTVLRHAAIGVLILLPIGVYRDWNYPRFSDLHFRVFVDEFNRAAPGTRVTIPVNPDWEMQLVKKP